MTDSAWDYFFREVTAVFQEGEWVTRLADGRDVQTHFADYLLRLTRLVHREMPYQDYLRTLWWREVREEALKVADYACQLCNARSLVAGPLHVHHRTYERRGFESVGDLTVLCERCHNLFHEHAAVEAGSS